MRVATFVRFPVVLFLWTPIHLTCAKLPPIRVDLQDGNAIQDLDELTWKAPVPSIIKTTSATSFAADTTSITTTSGSSAMSGRKAMIDHDDPGFPSDGGCKCDCDDISLLPCDCSHPHSEMPAARFSQDQQQEDRHRVQREVAFQLEHQWTSGMSMAPGTCPGAIIKFSLWDATGNNGRFLQDMANGSTICRRTGLVNIQAVVEETCPQLPVQSVQFTGSFESSIDNEPGYFMFQAAPGNGPVGRRVGVGMYSIQAVPWSQPNAQGLKGRPHAINFTVRNCGGIVSSVIDRLRNGQNAAINLRGSILSTSSTTGGTSNSNRTLSQSSLSDVDGNSVSKLPSTSGNGNQRQLWSRSVKLDGYDFVISESSVVGGIHTLLHAHDNVAVVEDFCDWTNETLAPKEVWNMLERNLLGLKQESATVTGISCATLLHHYTTLLHLANHSPTVKLILQIPDVSDLSDTQQVPVELVFMQLGKVSLSNDDFLRMSQWNLAVAPNKFSIFLYASEQIHDANRDRRAAFFRTLATFLGLSPMHDISDVWYWPIHSSVAPPSPHGQSQPCNVNDQLKQSIKWIRNVFLTSPDVIAANRDHLETIVHSWTVCQNNTDEEASRVMENDDEVVEEETDDNNDDDDTIV